MMSATQQKTRLGSFLAGLGALATFWTLPGAPMRYPHRNEADALKRDGIRIGDDLHRVIEWERTRAQAAAH